MGCHRQGCGNPVSQQIWTPNAQYSHHDHLSIQNVHVYGFGWQGNLGPPMIFHPIGHLTTRKHLKSYHSTCSACQKNLQIFYTILTTSLHGGGVQFCIWSTKQSGDTSKVDIHPLGKGLGKTALKLHRNINLSLTYFIFIDSQKVNYLIMVFNWINT